MSLQDLLGGDLDSESESSEEEVASPSEPQTVAKQRGRLKTSSSDSSSEEEEGEMHSDEETGQLPTAQDSQATTNESQPGATATVKELVGESEHSSSGEGEVDESTHESTQPSTVNTMQSSVYSQGMDDIFGDGDQEPEVPPEPVYLDAEIPKCLANLGSEHYFVKLPNFLSVEPRPFDPSLYEDEVDEDEMMDEEGRTRLKLKVENTIRWRVAKDENGDDIKESNARVVRWSDGSMSLLLGNEVFDIHKQQLLNSDHSHLFVRQGTGLQAQAVFKTKLTFRPHSTDSITHRKMTLSMADKFNKTQKIRVLPVIGKDPETQRTEMAKKEEERQRATMRRESKQRRLREKAASRGLSARFLEPDLEDDDDPDSLSAIKNSYKQGGRGYKKPHQAADMDEFLASDDEEGDGEGSEDESEEELEQARKLTKAKEDESSQMSSSPRKRTPEFVSPKGGSSAKRRKQGTKRIVESDDDESG